MEDGLVLGTAGLVAVNLLLAVIMFGVGLGLDLREFRRTLREPVGPTIGMLAQFVALPAVAFGFVRLAAPDPALALGVMIVCCCPGGTTSNIVTHLSRANVSLSIAMTTVSTFLALVLTPLNLAFWGSRIPGLDDLDVSLDPVGLVVTLVLVMGLPVALGAVLQVSRPATTARLEPIMRRVAVVGMLLLVVGAGAANASDALAELRAVLPTVIAVNALALVVGYTAAAVLRRPVGDRRAIAIEVGIQNAALAVTLSLQFFPEVGRAAIVAAVWGMWHLVSGLVLARLWSGRPLLASGS